ncbi:Emopamil-binding protein [Tricharina praecox]|uniref:Emopamil-binding protein n=1 Tax=Tricharina praecox TaxID=43433 RepID=UPI0022202B56|nr:Emopamil-binding protein [Tricharina praecox]KAI5854107.1 Emopamil-binding protein [Tricharina praecox]
MDEPTLISATTVFSLLLTVLLLVGAYGLSLALLPSTSTTKTRVIYIWHIFDSLTHFVLEGSFLYYSLTTSSTVRSSAVPTLYGDAAISYGTKFSTAPLGKLWNEYAKADRRWGEADVGIVCIELVTVLLAGPAALWVAGMVRRGEGRRWFWIAVLATAEIYGGWMTFAPEWIAGNHNLMTHNWMYKWLYLAFFNGLWVVIPGWLLCEAYWNMVPAVEMRQQQELDAGKKRV